LPAEKVVTRDWGSVPEVPQVSLRFLPSKREDRVLSSARMAVVPALETVKPFSRERLGAGSRRSSGEESCGFRYEEL
jgi:hypothetical protein